MFVVLITFENNGSKMEKRLKEYGIFYERVNIDDLDEFLKKNKRKVELYIFSGSTRRILRDGINPSLDRILRTPTPVIGICYGFQYMAMRSGGTLEDGGETSITNANLVKTVDYGGEKRKMRLWTSHYDKVLTLPTEKVEKKAAIKALWDIDFKISDSIYMAHTDKWIGYQFHPEYKKETFEDKMMVMMGV